MVQYAKSSVNVRDLPNTDGNRVGGLSTNQQVTVTGQCNETGWYRFDLNGTVAYVSNNYLVEQKVAVSSTNTNTAADTSTSTPTDTNTNVAADTNTNTSTNTNTTADTNTNTSADTSTNTSTSTSTSTPTNTNTGTSTSTDTSNNYFYVTDDWSNSGEIIPPEDVDLILSLTGGDTSGMYQDEEGNWRFK